MPIRVFNLGDFRKTTKDLSDDTIIAIRSTDEEETFYEHNCNGIQFFPAGLDAPPAIIIEAGQEITEDHSLRVREHAWLDNGVGKFIKCD